MPRRGLKTAKRSDKLRIYNLTPNVLIKVRTATAAPRFCRARTVSRRLLLDYVAVPSFDPRPERKRGRGSKLGGERAPVGRLHAGLLV